jgi:hypothetical protein
MKLMRCTARYTSLDHRRNGNTLELKVDQVRQKRPLDGYNLEAETGHLLA